MSSRTREPRLGMAQTLQLSRSFPADAPPYLPVIPVRRSRGPAEPWDTNDSDAASKATRSPTPLCTNDRPAEICPGSYSTCRRECRHSHATEFPSSLIYNHEVSRKESE